MNVYDFDGTIFPTDCSIGFFIWCMKHHPKLCFTFAPKVVKNLILRKMGKIPEYLMQREFFCYLTLIDDFDEQIERYWDKNEKKIAPGYLAQKKPDDLIIGPIAKRLGVNFMATEFNRKYGVFLHNLMYAQEKAQYMIDHGFPMIDNFYSDSLADTPIALCAEKAHLVKNKARTVVDWPDLDEETLSKIRDKVDTGWSVHLNE